MKLYTYWRSSCSYRVRIALNLKGMTYDSVPVHLVRDGGQNYSAEYRKINPQQLVPALIDGNILLRQSLAIVEYLEEKQPSPALLPADPAERAHVRAMAYLIADEMQPLNNIGVMRYLKNEAELSQAKIDDWFRHWVRRGFDALETMLASATDRGLFCHGDSPGLADICLVPQVYNARRFECDLSAYPTIVAIDERSRQLEPFRLAAPEAQADAE